MENEKKTFVDWVKEHKKELIIAGIGIASIITIIVGIKNYRTLRDTWEFLKKLVEKTPEAVPSMKSVLVTEVDPVKDIVEINIVTADRIPHDVTEHLRNLPEGWKASAEKIATAVEHGYELLPGQTWVEAYRTGGLAA